MSSVRPFGLGPREKYHFRSGPDLRSRWFIAGKMPSGVGLPFRTCSSRCAYSGRVLSVCSASKVMKPSATRRNRCSSTPKSFAITANTGGRGGALKPRSIALRYAADNPRPPSSAIASFDISRRPRPLFFRRRCTNTPNRFHSAWLPVGILLRCTVFVNARQELSRRCWTYVEDMASICREAPRFNVA